MHFFQFLKICGGFFILVCVSLFGLQKQQDTGDLLYVNTNTKNKTTWTKAELYQHS